MEQTNPITVKVVSVNISEKKGTTKHAVDRIELNSLGVKGDAHAGAWHRQVSMLGVESIEKFTKASGLPVKYGDFAENITTHGLELYRTKPGDRFVGAGVELEVTQIGKSCHGDGCAIYRQVGNCVMPKEGIFVRVLKGGSLKAGDELSFYPKVYRVKVITLSDRASRGEYEDLSGPEVAKLVSDFFNSIPWQLEVETEIIPDDRDLLENRLIEARNSKYDMVLTTGGTGIGPRDITPDVVKPLLDKEIPGIMEHIRLKYGAEKPNALLSRGVAGLMGSTFVYTLPGSVKAVREYMGEISKVQKHLFLMLMGIDSH
ncbi:MAG: molybdenum cofactor synthesis domain-containing protein [Tenuifilum sp.]|uniref:molybdenum cofactor synthesis domain-containing protein n=1 Tax=Tenuifilum sp. TaxID=2760880 RepID=UPI0030A54EA2